MSGDYTAKARREATFATNDPLQRRADEIAAADRAEEANQFDEIAEVGAEMNARLHDAAVVIERMANGASRAECSPELDRVIAALREIE